MSNTELVAIVHGCNKEEPRVIEMIHTDPHVWCKNNYEGKLVENEDECNFEFELPNKYITLAIDENKYAKKLKMLHTSCGLYITFVDKQDNKINEILEAITII